MDVHSARIIDHRTGMTKGPDNLLQLLHFAVTELGGVHLYLVFTTFNRYLPSTLLAGCPDAGVAHKLPDLVLPVRNFVGFVGPAQIPQLGSKQGTQRFCRLLSGDSRHLNFAAKILLL